MLQRRRHAYAMNMGPAHSHHHQFVTRIQKASANSFWRAGLRRPKGVAEVDPDKARAFVSDRSISGSFTGRAKKAWGVYQQRLDHLADAEKGFRGLAKGMYS